MVWVRKNYHFKKRCPQKISGYVPVGYISEGMGLCMVSKRDMGEYVEKKMNKWKREVLIYCFRRAVLSILEIMLTKL